MKIVLLVGGKTVGKELTTLISDYAGRVTHYIPFEMVTIPELKNTKSLSLEQ
ncbi:MAG: 23S rRNA (pseudouridine(1915)-N(3))-methyltransferase RlmH, partial [Bacteroidaceae bacterium]|nr:23S rRNA (pseudouridine(1915)-N(3))-methyltransferase RlmH [Bacteroidaceae bacterium]